MKSSLDIFIALILLAGYSYTLIYAHILLARADKKINIPKRTNGEIRLRDIKSIVSVRAIVMEPEIKKAVNLLRLNQYIVYAFFALLIYCVLFESVLQLSDLKNIYP